MDITDIWNIRFGALWDPSKIKIQPSTSGNGISIINVNAPRGENGYFQKVRLCDEGQDCIWHPKSTDDEGNQHVELFAPSSFERQAKNSLESLDNNMWFIGGQPLRKKFLQNYSGDWIAGHISEPYGRRFGILINNPIDDGIEEDIKELLRHTDDVDNVIVSHPNDRDCLVLKTGGMQAIKDYVSQMESRRTAALWERDKIKEQQLTEHKYKRVPFSSGNGYGMILPVDYEQEFKDKFSTADAPLWDNFSINALFSPKADNEYQTQTNQQVRDWMGNRNISWIALDVGLSNKWVLEQNKDIPMSQGDYNQLLDHFTTSLKGGWGVRFGSRPLDKGWYQWKFNGLDVDHAHVSFEKDCNECRDFMYNKLYPSTKTSALWERDKIKPLPNQSSDYEYGSQPIANGLTLEMPEEHRDEFLKTFNIQGQENDIDGIFGYRGKKDIALKRDVQTWMRERNIPWIGLSHRWIFEANPNEKMPRQDFDKLFNIKLPSGFVFSTRIQDSNNSLKSLSLYNEHSSTVPGHSEVILSRCKTCLDNTYKDMYAHLDDPEQSEINDLDLWSERYSALWDPSKIKIQPTSGWTALPLVFPSGAYASPTLNEKELLEYLDESLGSPNNYWNIYCPCENEHKLDGDCRWQNRDAIGNVWVPTESVDKFKRNTYGKLLKDTNGFFDYDEETPHVIHYEKKPNPNDSTEWEKEGWYNTVLIGGYGGKDNVTKEELKEIFADFSNSTGLRIESPKILSRDPYNFFRRSN